MFLSRVLNIGTFNQSFADSNKIRITNIIAIFTTIVSGLYTLAYFFVLDNALVAMINTAFTLAYAFTLLFNSFQANRGSKIWFFSVLMLHLIVCTNIYVTKESGFHLYYFLVPTGVYLVFDFKDKIEKITLSIIAVFLYFYCENTPNPTPLIELSDAINHVIYQSVIFVNMVEVILVMTIFSNEIETNEAKLIKQAKTDSLTGIANRHCFFEQGNALFKSSIHLERPFSLIILDFDHFKAVNDRYGHFIGDLCLTEISKVIKSQCRSNDLFARVGGEEFAIALPDTTMHEANHVAEKMRIAIESHAITITEEQHFFCTASFGISTKRSHHDDLKYLLVQADKALYLAKEKGRNRVQQFDAASNIDFDSINKSQTYIT